MDKRIAFWLASGAIILTVTLAGCQKKEEPAPPAASAPSDAGAVTQGQPRGNTAPAGTAATGETKKAEKQAAGTKTF
jgi:hypothetical protein